jgi:hypothetical protein
MEKKCNKCNVVKGVSEFGKRKDSKDGFRNDCKLCVKELQKGYRIDNEEKQVKYMKVYYKANKEEILKRVKKHNDANKDDKKEYDKKYREANRDKIKEYYQDNKELLAKKKKEYRKSNKEKIAIRSKKYRKSNKEQITKQEKLYKASEVFKEKEKHRRQTDDLFRLKLNTRRAVQRYLNDGKSKTTREIIDIDYKDFQDYLGVEYKENMHLDHIIPLSWANNDEEVYTLNHYSNFQIITAEENLAKSDRYCKLENLKKVLDNHNDLTKLNQIIERNSDKIK